MEKILLYFVTLVAAIFSYAVTFGSEIKTCSDMSDKLQSDSTLVYPLVMGLEIQSLESGTTRVEYTYDINNKRLKEKFTKFINNQWTNTTNYLYTYNKSGKRTSWTTQALINNVMKIVQRITYIYDENDLITKQITDNNVSNSDTPVTTSMYSYVYDSNKSLIEEIRQYRSGDSLAFDYRHTYSYNSENKMILELYDKWAYDNLGNGGWTRYAKFEDTYDDSGNKVLALSYKWKSGSWENSVRETWEYDNRHNNTMYSGEIWDEGKWSNMIKEEYTYDENDLVTCHITSNGMNDTWQARGKVQTEYNEDLKAKSILSQNYHDGQWNNTMLESFDYSINGKPIERLVKFWGVHDWVNNSLTTNSYDASDSLKEILQSIWQNDTWQNSRLQVFGYDQNGLKNTAYKAWENGSWIDKDTNFKVIDNNGFGYGYKGFRLDFKFNPTSIPDFGRTGGDDIYIYPNPTYDYLYIRTSMASTGTNTCKFIIYNISGDEVMVIDSSDKIDIRSLIPGIYYIKMGEKSIKLLKL